MAEQFTVRDEASYAALHALNIGVTRVEMIVEEGGNGAAVDDRRTVIWRDPTVKAANAAAAEAALSSLVLEHVV